MKYFVDPYKKYYEKLESIGNLSSQATSISSSVVNAKNNISNLSLSIDDSKWSEMGISELKTNVLPSLLQNHDTIANNINNILVKVVNKAMGELLPTLNELKTEDTKLETLNGELNNLIANPEYVTGSDGKSEYTDKYKNQLGIKEEDVGACDKRCNSLVQKVNGLVSDIKAFDSNVLDFKVDITSLNGGLSGTITMALGQSVKDGKMVEVQFNGKTFYVANTKINALDYERYVQDNKLTQSGGVLPGGCAILSQYYAMDMMRGTYTTREEMNGGKCGPSNRIRDSLSTESEDELLRFIYNEAVNGRVTTLQVTQTETVLGKNGHYAGPRHVVSVVGFDSSVKNPEDLNPDTILVLDCFDGKIQTLSQARDDGGHERDLYARRDSDGVYKYYACCAAEDFLTKEVLNDEWYASHAVKA